MEFDALAGGGRVIGGGVFLLKFVGGVAFGLGGFHEGFFDVVEGGAVAEFGGRGDAAEEVGGGVADEPDAPVVVVGEVGGDGAALGDATLGGEGFHEGAGGVVFGGGGRFGEEAGGDAEAGGALEVGELVVEVFRAGRN